MKQIWIVVLSLLLETVIAAEVPTINCETQEAQNSVRRRPGKLPREFVRDAKVECDMTRVVGVDYVHDTNLTAVPDRWRIVESLGQKEDWLDPYNQNSLKGDKPFHDDWFFAFTGVSDTVLEPRRLATPAGGSSSNNGQQNDIFAAGKQLVFSQTILTEFVFYRGETVYRPPDLEFRFSPALNFNYVNVEEVRLLNIDPSENDTRSDNHVGIQALLVDFHLRNVSTRYDFDSLRIGIQPFTADFRGFLFNDSPFGVRLFGTRDNNRYQYNIGVFRRLEKDTNSGLNDAGTRLRDDDLFAANLYWQDFFKPGLTLQGVAVYNRNRESDRQYYDENGFLQRPAVLGYEQARDYDVSYLGLNADGHIGRWGLSAALYGVFGQQTQGVFVRDKTTVRAGFLAAELSYDFSWWRARFSALWASGDNDPFDDLETGYDAIFENPLFAGADTSFWIRQGVPNIGGGGVALSSRNGVLNNLRSSKDHGQANFSNPGTRLIGLGFDADITAEWRLSGNANGLWFDDVATLEVARNQGDIARFIGTDVSLAAIWRPLAIQNIVLRMSAAVLLPGEAYKQMFDDKQPYSVLLNAIVTY